MAIKDINELKDKFQDDKEPNGADFGDVFDSYLHKTSRLSQNNVLGLNDELRKLDTEKAEKTALNQTNSKLKELNETKASKDELKSVLSGLRPMGSVETEVELRAIFDPNDNDSFFVKETTDTNSDPYIWRWDAIINDWVNTKQVVYQDVARAGGSTKTLKEVDTQVGALSGAFTLSRNLFNPNDVDFVQGRYLDFNGNPSGINPTYNTTGFIPVNEGDVIFHSNNGTSEDNIRLIGYYNTSKQKVNVLENKQNGITTPANVAYIRISFSSLFFQYQIEKDSVTAYAPFGAATATKLSTDSVKSENIKDREVTPEKLSAYKKSKNLLNPQEVTYNAYLEMGGAVVALVGSYAATGYIPIKEGQDLVCNIAALAGGSYTSCQYNASKQFIPNSGILASSGGNGGIATGVMGAAFVRFTLLFATGTPIEEISAQVEEGTQSTEFVNYSAGIDGNYIAYKSIGAVQIKDRGITTQLIKDKAITPRKTTFLFQTRNIYNPYETTIGYFITSNGTLQANPIYSISNYIPITEGQKVVVNWSNPSTAAFYAFYNDLKQIVPDSIQQMNGKTVFEGIENAAYLRFSLNTPDVFTRDIQAEYGEVSTDFVPHILLDNYVVQQSQANKVQDISLPSTLYMMRDVVNDLFYQPFTKRHKPYDYSVRPSTSLAKTRLLSSVVSLKPTTDGTIHFDLIKIDDFTTLKSITCNVVIGTTANGDNDVYAQVLGDSFTNGVFFKDALLDKGYCPKLHLVGLRKITGYEQYDEGRGGWALNSYFTIQTGEMASYHGYMHPQGNYRYIGSTGFWRNAWKVFNGTAGAGFEPVYSCGRFDDYLPAFNKNTGYKIAPIVGDLQYDNAKAKFVLWDGNGWIEKEQSEFTWSFDYAKYLATWNITQPKILFVMLGLNDFRGYGNGDDSRFADWKTKIETVIASYKAAVPTGKFALCTACSSCGSDDNTAGDFNTRFNAVMWDFRNWMIRNFDNRTDESIYIVDVSVMTDNVYGYNHNTTDAYTKPFDTYVGSDKIIVQTGNPHPYLSYPNMGIPLAAFIQKYRR